MTKPTVAQHNWNSDGTVTVVYSRDGVEIETVTYASSREASIESSIKMFPGTSRDWLERMHRR